MRRSSGLSLRLPSPASPWAVVAHWQAYRHSNCRCSLSGLLYPPIDCLAEVVFIIVPTPRVFTECNLALRQFVKIEHGAIASTLKDNGNHVAVCASREFDNIKSIPRNAVSVACNFLNFHLAHFGILSLHLCPAHGINSPHEQT